MVLITGAFAESRYWDVFAEYAKNTPNDVLCRITVVNRGPDTATIHVLPQYWFRNTWIWGCNHEGCGMKPRMSQGKDGKISLTHESLGMMAKMFAGGEEGGGRGVPMLGIEGALAITVINAQRCNKCKKFIASCCPQQRTKEPLF